MKTSAFPLMLLLTVAPLAADDAFGFDAATAATDDVSSGSASTLAVALSGELSSSVTAFSDDFDTWASVRSFDAGALASGTLKFSATGTNADAFAALDFSAQSDGEPAVSFDEAYVRAYFGRLDLETGFRKVTWGKADSSGPLDVINPLDLTDLTVTDSLKRKMARPMVRASYSLGDFTALELIFEPSFAGHQLALEGPWTPSQIKELKASPFSGQILGKVVEIDTSTLKYSQAGARFTTTVGSSDIGIQYWYGDLPTPAMSIDMKPILLGLSSVPYISIAYNRYHQIGADYASAFGKYTVRAELAANITEDLSGNDGTIYNPALAWSLGFDRDLFASINLNAQAGGSVRLMDGKVADDTSDTEAGTDLTHTTVIAKLSRKFMKDEFELALAGMYGIEDADFIALPSVVWSKGDVKVELKAGIFGGETDGELGQFDDNDYASVSLTYSF